MSQRTNSSMSNLRRYRIIAITTTVMTAMTASIALATSTPIQRAEIITPDGTNDDFFGTSVDIDGDRAIVGNRWDDDAALNAGSAYIYERNANGDWIQVAKFLPTVLNPSAGHYAHAVAISGNIAVVGAYGTVFDNVSTGAVYVYVRNGLGNWTPSAIIKPADVNAGQGFGRSLDLDGNDLLVGSSTDSPNGIFSGSAYLFRFTGSWTQIAKFIPNDPTSGANFGISCALDGTTALIGASSNTGAGPASGSAYVFTQTSTGPFGEQWSQQQKLIASDGTSNDLFGFTLDIDNDTAVIGAFGVGVFSLSTDFGAAYVFDRDINGDWSETTTLNATEQSPGDAFGYSVAIEDDSILIAAYHDNDNAGSATLFRRDADTWNPEPLIEASDAATGDEFGYAVALNDNHAIIGAPRTDDMGSSAGSSYIFELSTCLGDINGDNTANSSDLGLLIGAFLTTDPAADINGDGIVNSSDLGLLIATFGPCQ